MVKRCVQRVFLSGVVFTTLIGCQFVYGTLHEAVQSGNVGEVRGLLHDGSDVNEIKYLDDVLERGERRVRFRLGKVTPLDVAVTYGHDEIAQLLVKSGAHVDHSKFDGGRHQGLGFEGRNTLLRAVESGNSRLLRFLLLNEADPNYSFGGNPTALFAVVEGQRRDMLSIFLARGIDPTIANSNSAGTDRGLIPLHAAARNGDLYMVEKLLQTGKAKEQVKVEDPSGRQPLWLAAEQGNADVVRALLGSGADVKARNKRQQDALNIAARKGHENVVFFLLTEGAEVNGKDADGRTPLFYAYRDGHAGAALILKEAGGKVPDEDALGASSLNVALVARDTGFLERLRNEGQLQDVNAVIREGRRPLHIAAATGRLEHVKKLLEWSATVDARDEQGRTPLLAAASKGEDAVVDALLDAGADVNAVDIHGNTALGYAVAANDLMRVRALKRRRATYPQQVKTATPSPLHSAIRHGNLELLREVLEISNSGSFTDLDPQLRTPVNFAMQTRELDAGTRQRLLNALLKRIREVASNVKTPLTLQDIHNRSPLHYAAANNNLLSAQTLLDNVRVVDAALSPLTAVDNNRRTPLHVAAQQRGGHELVQHFLKHRFANAALIKADIDGETPLEASLRSGDEAVMREMFTKYQDPNLEDGERRERLFNAIARHRSVRGLQLAKEFFNVDVNAVLPKSGLTPLGAAARSGANNVVKALLAAGAEMNAVDGEGKTALDRAVEGGFSVMTIKMLKDEGAEGTKDATREYLESGKLERDEPPVDFTPLPAGGDKPTDRPPLPPRDPQRGRTSDARLTTGQKVAVGAVGAVLFAGTVYKFYKWYQARKKKKEKEQLSKKSMEPRVH